MPDEAKKLGTRSRENLEAGYPKERGGFKSLLLTNPNYFGTLAASPLTPVLPLANNTFYESLGCVGYQPQQEQLEAVVYIYQPTGYGTDICGSGTPEYVRFYLSFDNGVNWQDEGLTSFQAYNIPAGTEGRKRLEYAVSLPVNPQRKFCIFDPLIQVRAILSWNNPPPPNQPNWTPVWGNVQQAAIQVESLRWLYPLDIFNIAKVKLPPILHEVLDLETPIEAKKKKLGAVELSALYKEKDVPVHRFAHQELTTFASAQTTLSAEHFLKFLPDIQIDAGIIGLLFPDKDGDTSFEELKCIGLDPNTPDTLVGIIQVKKSSGYSGGLCTQGSSEYVTFWGDFDGNGSFETCLGTTSVQVYDLPNIPPEGVYYAVRLPVDLNEYRRNCKAGARVVPIRAILSWDRPVDCANPNSVPAWGNREETLINIAPKTGAPPGQIAILGGIPVSKINSVTGYTTHDAVFATNNLAPDVTYGRPCPFAGRVTVQGAPLVGSTYRVEAIPVGGGAPVAVLTDLVVTRQDGTNFTHMANPITGRFNYLNFTDNVNSLLAQWDTNGDSQWDVTLYTYDAAGNFLGYDQHRVQLDNTAPVVSIEITSGTGNCGKFTPGTLISGKFVARDSNFASFDLGLAPSVNDPGEGIPDPDSGIIQTALPPGDTWELDTKGMRACGYVIWVSASDLAIVDSQSRGHHVSASAGFCLDLPGEDC